MNMFLPCTVLEEKLRKILTEDIGQGDVTTSLIIAPSMRADACVIAKQSGFVAGIEEAEILLKSLGLEVKASVRDGEKITARQVLLKLSGDARTILSSERTLLDLLSRMSGIATATRRLVDRLRETRVRARIACTRKTAPGLLYFDKKAVLVGGGDTHRLHLDDMVLIKDNHIALVGSVEKAVKEAKQKASFSKKIEVEVTRIEDVVEAVEAGADIVMLDNFPPPRIKKVIALLEEKKYLGKLLLEASGGITAENVSDYASSGVDFVSLGEITQGARALDMSLEIVKAKRS